MKVFVTIWFHRYGEDVAVRSTREKAEEDRQRVAAENWDQEIGPDTPKPEDPVALADAYFEIMGEAPQPEYFDTHELGVDA